MSGSQAVRVLIVARDEAVAGSLGAGLDALGWRTITARGAHAAQVALEDLPIEAALVVVEDADAAATLAGRLRAQRAPRALPVVGVRLAEAQGGDDAAFDLTLAAACHPYQVALRLEQLVRAAAAEEEWALRLATLAAHGGEAPAPAPDRSALRVLTVGEPAPKFLALSHALRARGAEVTAAFTAYTAFDYLHERAFDAVALWAGGETQAEALSIAAGMRRNSRLFHLPTLLYLPSRAEIDVEKAYRRGLTDIATADTPAEETARRTVGLARAYRREVATRRSLEAVRGAGLMEASTGLFTPELFAAHLAQLAAVAGPRPLSVALMRVGARPELERARRGGWLDAALPQIGSMIGRLVRAEDTAGRLGPEVFALALPRADAGAASRAAARIAAVIGCTAFSAGEGERPFTVEFDIGVAACAPGEPAGRALRRAAADMHGRP